MILELENLTRRFGSRTAIQDVNLQVEAGEVYGLLGPNGAGKTTVIRIILGLVRADSGRALVAGYDCWRQHVQAARHYGAVLEVPGFCAALTGRQNLRQFARLVGSSASHEIDRLLDLVDLTDRADDLVRRYSLGMRQRLALAQALLGRPRLLVLDEPTNGLDPIGIQELRGLIRRLARQEGIAVFLSSHLLPEAEAVCDRVAVLSHGFTRARCRVADLAVDAGVRVEVQVSDTGRARAALAAIPGLEVVESADPERLEVRSQADMGEVISSRLIEAGVGVREMRRLVRSLEDFFLEATQRETTEAAVPAAGARG
jgi:ABC-2 type transport system ATP-binding protein